MTIDPVDVNLWKQLLMLAQNIAKNWTLVATYKSPTLCVTLCLTVSVKEYSC